MATRNQAKVVEAERLLGGVLITFSTGEEGFYSDEMLYGSLREAQEMLRTLEQTGS